MEKMERIYGNVLPSEKILEEFYTARQGARESVAEWACRIEELVAQLERRDALSAGAAHGMLRTKFYSGLSRSQLRSALRHRFDGGESYAKLLVAARVAELEVSSVGSNQVGVESMLNDKLDKVLEEMSSIRKRVERLEVGKLRRVAGSGQAASRKNGKRSQLIGEANEVIVNVGGVEVQALSQQTRNIPLTLPAGDVSLTWPALTSRQELSRFKR
ncbi:hypothetical protein CAPTEDRAFT_208319 [Capitella teleta]|uniref:Retrotransposon gag domain-containing protein n=1 Tax=Capitella teleta TaxID=283909 RepID=R7T3P3_CAPTE|nr:hypothetical protein CAPTEDRAFT_208319 [Capitella teleta]|eukprot:ELT87417.1 hypothetical protein CAPTEDRAFT_208319 [Capitella teleta]